MELMVVKGNSQPFHPAMWIDPAQADFVVLAKGLKVDDSPAWYGMVGDHERAIFGYVSDLSLEQAVDRYLFYLQSIGCEQV